MTDLSLYLPCGYISSTDNLLCGEFLLISVCHVEKFLHMADFSPQALPVVPVTNMWYDHLPSRLLRSGCFIVFPKLVWSGCDMDAVLMQSGCGLDAVWMWSGCSLDAVWRWFGSTWVNRGQLGSFWVHLVQLGSNLGCFGSFGVILGQLRLILGRPGSTWVNLGQLV